MSQYTFFFLRTPHNEFIPLATFTQSAYEAQIFHGPYGHIAPLTDARVKNAMDHINRVIAEIERLRAENEETLKWIATSSSPLDEKLEARESIQQDMRDLQHDLEEAQAAASFTLMLSSIQEEASDSQYWTGAPYKFDPEAYIYCGVECSPYPTLSDVKTDF